MISRAPWVQVPQWENQLLEGGQNVGHGLVLYRRCQFRCPPMLSPASNQVELKSIRKIFYELHKYLSALNEAYISCKSVEWTKTFNVKNAI